MSINFIQINSDRLFLRPIRIEDADSIFLYRSNAIVNQYQGWVPKTIDDAYNFISNKVSPEINQPDTWFQFVIIEKESSKIIGDIGVHFPTSDSFQIELGCTLSQEYQGKGYAFGAVKATINYLFDELGKRRIIASIDSRNLPSIRLIERLGFRKKAHIKESTDQNNERVDDLVYALLKDEWVAKK